MSKEEQLKAIRYKYSVVHDVPGYAHFTAKEVGVLLDHIAELESVLVKGICDGSIGTHDPSASGVIPLTVGQGVIPLTVGQGVIPPGFDLPHQIYSMERGETRWARTCGVCKKEYYIAHDVESERKEELHALRYTFADMCQEHYDEKIMEAMALRAVEARDTLAKEAWDLAHNDGTGKVGE